MKLYTLKHQQFLPISIDRAWQFFSSPANLKKITPKHMGFEITSEAKDGEMYSGMIISYRVKPFPGIPMTWVSEIKEINAPYYFIDEQRIGPYALWHHQHHFKEIKGGTEITDIVNYAMPFGLAGRLAHALFVKRQLRNIFDYRKKAIAEITF